MIRVLTVLVMLLAGCTAAASEALHKLKGRIVRSLAVGAGDPQHLLVGQKGKAAGSGLVFQSLDGGMTWRTLNGNRPLAAKATDVQAVAVVSKRVLLAGTWKHGLFISRDGGRRFVPVKGVPGRDIRDLLVDGENIYAATARDGVFVSSDQGATWMPIGPGRDFLWSLSILGSRVAASSPETGVHVYGGTGWTVVFDGDKSYGAAAGVVAGESGLHLNLDGRRQTVVAGERFADVNVAGDGQIVAGSWQNGVVLVSPQGRERKRLLAGQTVVHVQISDGRLLAGTWGDGLHILPLSEVLK